MRGSLYVFLGGCSYGVLSTFVKIAYGDGYSMGQVVLSQYLFGTIMLLGVVFLMKRRNTVHLPSVETSAPVPGKTNRKQKLQLLSAGAVVALTGIFYYAALNYISASLAILMLFQFTWIGVLIEAISKRQLPSLEKALALVLLIIGTVLATGVFTEGFQGFHWLGILFGFLAAISHSAYIFFSGRVAVMVEPMTRALYMNTGALIFITVIFPPTFLFTDFQWLGLIGFGLMLGVFGPFFSTYLFMKGVPLTGTGLAAILGSSELPMATLMASVVLGESVGILKWVGVAIILGGISLSEIWKRMKQYSSNSIAS